MSEHLTDKEKTAIALEAASGDEATIQQLAEKHNVTEGEIRSWTRETRLSSVDENQDNLVSLEASEDFVSSVEYGATFDNLNYKRLTFWTLFGSGVFTFITIAIIGLYGYTFPGVERERSEVSRFYQIQQLDQNTQSHLESFGVVDPEQGIYRIPVDSAITLMAEDF